MSKYLISYFTRIKPYLGNQAGHDCTTVQYEAGSERVTERVLREDKTHSTGLIMSDPDILVPNKQVLSCMLSSHA